MIRLQRVTLLALQQYLGLSAELIAKQHRGDMNIKFTDEPEDADTGAGVTIPGAESLEVPDTAEAEQPLTPGTPSALQLQLESYQELSGASPARLQSRWGQGTEKIFGL